MARLEALGMPMEAYPQGSHGQHSYTVRLGDAVLEVQLPIQQGGKKIRAGTFLVKRPPAQAGGRSVPWQSNGGVAAAWEAAKARAGLGQQQGILTE